MNIKKYLSTTKREILKVIFYYLFYILIYSFQCYLTNNIFNLHILPPYIFKNTITYTLIVGILLYPLIREFFLKKKSIKNKKFNKEEKKEYDKTLIILASELLTARVTLEIIKKLFNKFKTNNKIYEKYGSFFYFIYFTFHDQLIFNINRLHDGSNGALSIIHLLKSNINRFKDKQSSDEKKILKKIKCHPVHQKSKILRNKLGKGHLDKKIFSNEKLRKKIYEKNKINTKEYFNYIQILIEAINILHQRINIIYSEMNMKELLDHPTFYQIDKFFVDLQKTF